ncbi:hypothetical protein F5Y17DRAFT_321386 [Xylariaceae sp. FL0594]|nr:hypothetical protein F5Y17DRAFT_321386 [Xylariaceae sp. FL0594]
MSSRKKGDIRGFFKPTGPSSPQPRRQSASPPSQLPALLSSPRTPQRPARRVFGHDEEIRGSDDDGSEDDSDDSLGSITEALGFRSRPANHQRDGSILSTPQAKRIASGIHRSPLTLQPKREKHRFDLKALVNHSRDFERTEESVNRADALLAQDDKDSEGSDESDPDHISTKLEQASSHLFRDIDNEQGKGDKLRRALKRSNGREVASSRRCYFFDEKIDRPKPAPNTFPRNVATGLWKCLSQVENRRRSVIMGMPHTFVAKGQILPDDIYQWILDEVSAEQNAELRRQYISLAGVCKHNTRRLVDDARLYRLLERMGGPRYSPDHSRIKSTVESRPGYLEQDWTPLVAFLQLLGRIAPHLERRRAICAAQLLLRMSLDPVVSTVVHDHFTRTMTALVSRLARYNSLWNTSCDALCSYVCENMEDLELKATAVLSIPSSTSRLVDLRRRIAATALFKEPGLGSNPTGPQLSRDKIYARLREDDFAGVTKPDFDFEQLRVLTTLLDTVIDRADFLLPCHVSPTTDSSSHGVDPKSTAIKPESIEETQTNLDAETERKFNADVDALADRIKRINDLIRDKDSRKNVKLGLLGLEKRLRYAVRTKPPPKMDIFSVEAARGRGAGGGRGGDDKNIPKQRDFMRQWAAIKKENNQLS